MRKWQKVSSDDGKDKEYIDVAADTGPRTLAPNGFKHLFAQYSASQKERESQSETQFSDTSNREDDGKLDAKIAKRERHLLDYLNMAIKYQTDPNTGEFVKIEPIVFWSTHSSRFSSI